MIWKPVIQFLFRIIVFFPLLHAGDFIRYIICISTDPLHPLASKSLGDRAFSLAEIRSSHGVLQPDLDWYFRNQLLPTLSRLVSPLEDVPRSYLCECLGIDAGYLGGSGGNEGGSMEEFDMASSFKPWTRRTDYEVMYARADPIYFTCKACGKQHSFGGNLHAVMGSSVGFRCTEVCYYF